MSDRQLLVSKIENGIVIDHIPAGKAFLVLKLLRLDPSARVLIALNVDSRRLGVKDIVKVEGSYLTSREIELIALVAPNATLNIIEGWKIKEKRPIGVPEVVRGVFTCPNPLCPTNSKYSPPRPIFRVEAGDRIEALRLHCKDCGSTLYYGSIIEQIDRGTISLEGGGLVSKGKIERVFLDLLLRKGALRLPPSAREPFILKSGRPSPYFINLGVLTDGESLATLKWAFASYIALLLEQGEIEDFEYIFGPSYKGISLAALACEGLNELYGMDKRYMYDRKEEKAYGDTSADRVIVGAGFFKPGQRILVVDDTITTGATKMDTFEKLKLLGPHKVVGLVVAVDRQERMGDAERVEEKGAAEYIEEEMGVKVYSIQNVEGIYRIIKDSLDEEMRRLWIEYYAKYGTTTLE
ncbi:orotate phosphoribosyltransferase [Candidatus Bathyarchaeota archaeon]|nr:orotate phosphoribosyltransferase [Candidatus Bathyarchaeota archaeon]